MFHFAAVCKCFCGRWYSPMRLKSFAPAPAANMLCVLLCTRQWMIACPSCHPPVGRPYSKKYRNAILGMITLAPRQITGNPSLIGSDCAWFRMVCGFAPSAYATSTTESVSFVDSLIWSSVMLSPLVQLVRLVGWEKIVRIHIRKETFSDRHDFRPRKRRFAI